MSQNIDAYYLRNEAFENVESVMCRKTFNVVSAKLDEKDVVSNFAKTWFGQKEASKH